MVSVWPFIFVLPSIELTFCKEPSLSPGARAVVKSYGGWTNFMNSFGLKPWNSEDVDEGKAIAEGMAAEDTQ